MPIVLSHDEVGGPETEAETSAAENEPEESGESCVEDTTLTASSEVPDDGKTKQAAASGPNVDVGKSSSSVIESGGEGQSDSNSGSQNPESEDSSELPNLMNGDAIQERKEDEFGIIDNVYYRLFYLRHFRFDDISVQIDGNILQIEAKHKAYTDEHGFSTRTFIRQHHLPKYVIAEKLTSYFTGDGVLVIQAPCSKTM